MKKIIHLSDLHFGTQRPGIVNLLHADILQMRPDFIVVSGDLTQRARTYQFQEAKNFLRSLNAPVICVPGNHDIPLYNLFERLSFPFYKYKKWISETLCVHYISDNISLLGINSVTPYKPMGGYVTDDQLKLVVDFFQQQPKKQIKIVMMHHNLIRSERHKIINDSEKIIEIFAQCNINLVLSGHIHFAHLELLKHQYHHHSMYVVTAGTAISTRTIAPNSYNILEVNPSHFKLSVREFTTDHFATNIEKDYPF